MKIKTWQYVVIGLLTVVAVGLVALDAWLTPYDLGKERSAARAAGIPLTPVEFKHPQIPLERDAAPDWLTLDGLLRIRPLNTDNIDVQADQNGTLPPAAMPAVSRLLNDRTDVTSLIRRATDKPDAHFEHTWRVEEEFPYLSRMRNAARLLRWESLMLAREGGTEEAIRSQARAFRVADHAAMDPVVISFLVSVAVEQEGLEGLKDILQQADPNESTCASVRRTITANPSRRDLPRVMMSDTLLGVTTFRRIRSVEDLRATQPVHLNQEPLPLGTGRSNPLVRAYMAQQGEAAYLRWMTRYVAASRRHVPERAAAFALVSLDLGERSGEFLPPGQRLAINLIPVLDKPERRDTACLANRRVLLAACDVLEYRARTGSWPSRIQDATPRPPIDPINDKPIGYLREGSGFVLYSVGEERTFAAKRGQPERGQAVFRYPMDMKP